MGLAALMQLDCMKLALPAAHALAREAGHTVALAVAGSHGPTVVHIVESRIPIHLNLRKGSVMSLWGSATGRVFATWLPAEQVERLSRRELSDPDVVGAARGPGSAAQRKALLSTVRRDGLARIEGQLLPGVHALSAPVFDHTGALVMAITLLGPAAVFDASATGPLARLLRDCTARLSRSLGWSPA
jgi:DNA-binding IclR family transcriptional regulator